MENLIARLLGMGKEGSVSIEQIYLRLSWPGVAVLGCLLAAVAVSVLLYRRERNLPRLRRGVLAAVRAGILCIMILLLMEPVVAIEQTTKLRRNILVLMDSSQSMGISDLRREDRDLQDAALALGKVQFAPSSPQLLLVRASRAMHQAAEAIQSNNIDDATAFIQKAQDALVKGKAEIDQSVKANASDQSLAEVSGKLGEIDAQLGQVAAQVSARHGESKPIRDLGAKPAELAGNLDKLTAHMRANIPLSDELRGQLGSVPRIDLAKGILNYLTPTVLGGDYQVRYFQFGDALDPVTGMGDKLDESLRKAQAAGKSTRLGEAMLQAVDRYAGQPIAAVIVLTDGASNEGLDPLEAATQLRQRDIPVFTVGIGLPEADDINLRTIITPEVIFQKDDVPVHVQIATHGYAGQTVQMKLTFEGEELLMYGRDMDRDGNKIGKRTMPVTLVDGTQFEEFSYKIDSRKGPGTLTLSIDSPQGAVEASVANNKVSQGVNVRDDKIKVLYIEGKPRWEYRYLRAILKRDRRLDVKFLMTEGDPDLADANRDEYLSHFPDTGVDAFPYDLIILGDVKSSYFTKTQLEVMADHIKKHSASLLMLAGHKYAPATYVDTPIADLLPVRFTNDPPLKADKTAYPVVTADGLRSEIVMLDTEDKNAAVWAQVKPMYDLPVIQSVKPGATVLAKLSQAPASGGPADKTYPLVVWQRVDSGKSMFIASDQLWRLRYKTGDKYHARFWGQTIQFMTLSRLLGGNKRIRMEMDKSEFHTGERVRIYANLLTEAYEPARLKEYKVFARGADGTGEPKEIRLEPIASSPGSYEGYFTPTQDGSFTLGAGDEDAPAANSVNFKVTTLQREMLEPTMQELLLRKTADLSGGQYVPIRDLPGISGLIEGQTQTETIRKEHELWDLWVVFFAIVALAAVEWFVRRRSDLA